MPKLIDSTTGDDLGDATEAQVEASRNSPDGSFLIDGDGDVHQARTGPQTNGPERANDNPVVFGPLRTVYVD